MKNIFEMKTATEVVKIAKKLLTDSSLENLQEILIYNPITTIEALIIEIISEKKSIILRAATDEELLQELKRRLSEK